MRQSKLIESYIVVMIKAAEAGVSVPESVLASLEHNQEH